MADVVHDVNNVGASISSGSFRTAGMVIAPCSMKSMGGIAHSLGGDLLVRAADVVLKERKKLVLVVRETPLHLGHLEAMVSLTKMGAMIFPPVPAFYHRPKTLDDIINQTVARILDQFDIDVKLFHRWDDAGHEPSPRRGQDSHRRRDQRSPSRQRSSGDRSGAPRSCRPAGPRAPSRKPKNAKRNTSSSVSTRSGLPVRRPRDWKPTASCIMRSPSSTSMRSISVPLPRQAAQGTDPHFLDDRRVRSCAQSESQSGGGGADLGLSHGRRLAARRHRGTFGGKPRFRCAMWRRTFCFSAISAQYSSTTATASSNAGAPRR